jgi:hypothetical protein
VVVYFLEIKGKKEEGEEKLINIPSENITKISLQKENETFVFEREKENEWRIVSPLEVEAEQYEVNRLADDFSDLKIERVVEETATKKDLEKYKIPSTKVSLWTKDKIKPIVLLIGMENPLDQTLYAKREDDQRIVLIPSYLKSLIDKSLFDFRKKDIFEFEKDKVKKISVTGRKFSWQAIRKDEDEWFMEKPIKSLIESGKVSNLLYNLSSLRAEKFISEEKTDEEMKKYGLNNPDFKVTLNFPSENKEITFFLNKKDDKLYATTSLSSKIITADDLVITDLEKKPDELREKNVVVFYTFEVKKLEIKRNGKAFLLEEDEESNWNFIKPEKVKADNSKVESFLTKIADLETKKFIDPPFKIKKYGLDKPQAEINIWTEEDNKLEKHTLLIGIENKDKKEVYVRNTELPYLFVVESSFLKEFPEKLEAWEKVEEKKEK